MFKLLASFWGHVTCSTRWIKSIQKLRLRHLVGISIVIRMNSYDIGIDWDLFAKPTRYLLWICITISSEYKLCFELIVKQSFLTVSLSIGWLGLIKSRTDVSSHITDWKTLNQTFTRRFLRIFPGLDFYGRETLVLTYRNSSQKRIMILFTVSSKRIHRLAHTISNLLLWPFVAESLSMTFYSLRIINLFSTLLNALNQ